MKPEELRIGNWINCGGSESVMIANDFAFFDDLDASPILLTPEWLERFGFEKNTHEEPDGFVWHEYVLEDWVILPRRHTNLFWVFIEEFDLFGDESGVIYVHQLQNLYYALTGKEL